MKVLLIISIFLIGITTVKGQPNSKDKIYWIALDKYIHELDSLGTGYYSIGKTIFLEKSEYVDTIPPEINGYRIILITQANQRKLYKDHGNMLVHTIMSPIAVKDSLISINFTPYHGTFKHNNYNLLVSDGITVYFKFDCLKKQFFVFKVEEWGI